MADIVVEVRLVKASKGTNPRQLDNLTTFAIYDSKFVGDVKLTDASKLGEYLDGLGPDLVYLHIRRKDTKLRVDTKCIKNVERRPNWAGIVHAPRSAVLKLFAAPKHGRVDITGSFSKYCQQRVDDMQAFQQNDIFKVLVKRGKSTLAYTDVIYGQEAMRRRVVQFLKEYNVGSDHVISSSKLWP